ncbi:hypothetical protein GCM10029992_45920 [Glycomyces albus]
MGTDDRPDPHLNFLELTDQIVEELALHNLKAREKLREGIAWLEARRMDATSDENADIEILLAQCHDALKRMESLRDTYQDVRAINAASHAEHVEWLEKRMLGGTESPRTGGSGRSDWTGSAASGGSGSRSCASTPGNGAGPSREPRNPGPEARFAPASTG